jgi:hypothetical protein
MGALSGQIQELPKAMMDTPTGSGVRGLPITRGSQSSQPEVEAYLFCDPKSPW